jgi:sugar-specific transcriptional regulator TrmB
MSDQTSIYKLIDDFRKEIKDDMRTMEGRLVDNQNRIEAKLDQAIIKKVDELEKSFIAQDKELAKMKTEYRLKARNMSIVYGSVAGIVTSVVSAYLIYKLTGH